MESADERITEERPDSDDRTLNSNIEYREECYLPFSGQRGAATREGASNLGNKHSRTEEGPDGSRERWPSACALPTRPIYRESSISSVVESLRT